MHLQVNVPKLNKRWLIPLSLPDRANIAGEVHFGFSFEGEEVDTTLIPNPSFGKWYKDRDGYYYSERGVIDITADFEVESRVAETAGAEAFAPAVDLSKLGWGLKMLHMQTFWDQAENMGDGINIAILDTGISSGHPDFDYTTMKHFNVLDGSTNTEDTDGHGTHIAGIVAAQGREVIGSALNAKLLIIKIAEKAGTWKIEDVIKGIEEAIVSGADIISISGEFTRFNSKLNLLHQSIISAHQKGIIIVGSAGNNFSPNATDFYPAAFDECISIGAIKEDKTRADFSSLSTKLDLVSPGHNIKSTWIGQAYKEVSGTSQATPLITGIIAVLKSYARKEKQKELTPSEVYILLTKNADDAGVSGHDTAYGFGIINPASALASI